MAYSWAHSVRKLDEAVGFLKAGLEANPTSFDFLFWLIVVKKTKIRTRILIIILMVIMILMFTIKIILIVE